MFPPYNRRILEAKKLQSLSEDIDVDSDVSAETTTTTSRPNSRQAKLSTLSIDSTLSRSGSIGSTASPIVRTMGSSSSTSRARSKAVKSSRTAIVASSSTSVSPIHNQAAAALLQLSVSTTNSNTINHTNNATTTTSTSRNTMTTANTDEHDNTYTTSNTNNTTSTSNIPEDAQIPTFDALLGSSRRQGGEGVFFPDPCPDDLTAMRLPSDSSFNFTYDPSTSFDQLNLDDSNTPPLPAPDPVSDYPDRYVPDTVVYESTMNLVSVANQPLNIEDSSNTTDMYTTRNNVVDGSSTIDKDNTEDGMSPLLPTLESFLFGPDSTTNSPILPITSRKSITASSVTAHIEAMTIAEKGLTTIAVEGSEMDTTTDSLAL